jgi:phosphate-selective porin OprO/OprP
MIGGISKLNRYLLACAGAIGILAAGGMSAKAADVAQLEAQMRAMQAQMAALQKEVQEAKAAAANSGGGDLDLNVKWKGAPELSSKDGKFKFKVRGRVMADFNHIDQDYNVTGRPDVDAVELRRARLGVEGVVFYDVKYKFEADFAANEVAIKDAYVAYAGLKPKDWGIGEIRFGNQYVYNSIEEITSSRFITFMERPAYQEAFFLDRQIGAAILAGSEHWSFQTGIYGAPLDGGPTPAEVTDYLQDQNAWSVRGTWAPINRDVNGVHQVLHVGASFRHRDEAQDLRSGTNFGTVNDDQPFRYRARGADLHLADRFIATPFIGGDDDLVNLEAVAIWGPFSVQGEYARLDVNSVNPPFPCNQNGGSSPSVNCQTANPNYNGWYVDASWYLTGETRTYEGDTGEIGRPKVKHPVLWGEGQGGYGAWQIAGRYDVLNLADDNAKIVGFKGTTGTDSVAVACTFCGNQQTWLIGVNWWLNDYTALKLNVTQTHVEGSNPLNAFGSVGANQNKTADITGVGLRAQVDW